jgi:putative transport protein
VLVGQLKITISPTVKSTFFLMFLFAVGYSVGPQFFRGLKSGGLKQVIFASVLALTCLLSAVLMGRIMHYDAGLTAGLLSGACTISAVLGVATDSINQLGLSADQKKAMIDSMPVAYAVTYIFGTAGSAWILASLGPKILRIDLPKECAAYEAQMGGTSTEPGVISAYQELVVRAYKVSPNCRFVNKAVAEVETAFTPFRVFVERVRTDGHVLEAQPATIVHEGEVLAIAGRREPMMHMEESVGPEVDDRQLLDFPAEIVDVVVTSKDLPGQSLKDISSRDNGDHSRGVFLRKLTRAGIEMPFHPGTVLDRGDVLTIAGARRNVERAIEWIGYPDRSTDKTDMSFMGLGIAVGALVGTITIHFGHVPLNLSTSGGALIAGLLCGWLRSVHRTFGRIPEAALWVFNNVGLNAFIAVVGISAGPAFVSGLINNGLGLFMAGIVVTTLPFIVGLLLGKYVFKFHPAINLGACAGARTTTAALGAIEDAANSKVPALGYTVPYAVGNTLLTIWGVIIILLMK